MAPPTGLTRRDVAEAHDWARDACRSLGMRIVAPSESVHARPWSTVFRVPTSGGAVYGKCCGPTQEHEPRLTALLHREFPGLGAEVLALHSTRPWMLVAEGGKKLGEMYSGDELLRKWREILPRCALMQRDVTPLTNEIIAFGTPDRRAARLLAGFADVVAGEPEVSGRRPDRLSADERRALTSVHARLAAGLNALAALGIDHTLNHHHLHHNNLLVQRG